jgi:hypothetical protein
MVGLLGVLAVGPPAATTEVEDIYGGPPWGVLALEIQEHSSCGAHPSGMAVNGCRNIGINDQIVVRTIFTLTQVGHFY